MKILIGILHTIENEFSQCLEAIHSQTYKNFDYFILHNLPNKKAHDTLYQKFMSSAATYDLFVKVDADMVLSRTTFFEEMVMFMKSNKKIVHLTIPVHDFFTDHLIWGLHVYRNTIVWNMDSDRIFVDRLVQNTNQYCDTKTLSPAAYHCPDPSHYQSFHFGIHKAVKFSQYNEKRFQIQASLEHWWNIVRTYRNYRIKNDIRLRYALIGMIISIKKQLTHKHIDVNCKELNDLYEQCRVSGHFSNAKRKLTRYYLIFCNRLFLIFYLRKTHKIALKKLIKILRIDFKKKYDIDTLQKK